MNTATTTASIEAAFNPYAAPQAHPAAPAATPKLFTASQVGVGAFLAVPAGLAMLAMNLRRVGKSGAAAGCWLLVPVLTVLLVGAGVVLPQGTPVFLMPLAIALVLRKSAESQFRTEYDAAAIDPSLREGFGKTLMIVIIGAALALGCALAASILMG